MLIPRVRENWCPAEGVVVPGFTVCDELLAAFLAIVVSGVDSAIFKNARTKLEASVLSLVG